MTYLAASLYQYYCTSLGGGEMHHPARLLSTSPTKEGRERCTNVPTTTTTKALLTYIPHVLLVGVLQLVICLLRPVGLVYVKKRPCFY